MKALFFHADRFGFDVESPSERICGSAPEEIDDTGEGSPKGPCTALHVEDCLVTLFHVEEWDGPHQVRQLCKDIRRVAQHVGANRLVVAAFGHLSHVFAPPEVAAKISREVVNNCRSWEGFEVHTSPFGHNKTLILHTKGHADAVKHRSY